MMIDQGDDDMDRAKEVKVKIPIGYHVRLHSMKVLTGKQISTAVTEALEAYFEDLQDGDGAQVPASSGTPSEVETDAGP